MSVRSPSQPALDLIKPAVDLVDPSADFVDPSTEVIESLPRLRLKHEQVFVHAFDPPGQESERARDFADAAFQIANFVFDIQNSLGRAVLSTQLQNS